MGKQINCTKDRFYVCATLFMVAVTLLITPDIVSSVRKQQASSKDAVAFADLAYAVGLAALLSLTRRVLATPFSVLGDLVIARKPDWSPSYREKKISRFSEQLYKLIYAITMSSLEWYLLLDQPFFPNALGGSGDIRHAWYQRDGVPPLAFRFVYWMSLAYNIEDFLSHTLFVEQRSDYYEMIFHHCMAICLIVISYFTNHWRIGTIVLIVHDIPDICAHGIKCSVDGSNIPRTLALYIGLLITWGYYRLWVFPSEVVYSAAHALDVEGVWIMILMAVALLSLHIYWYSMFISMGMTFLKTGKAEDTQQLIIEKPKKGAVVAATTNGADTTDTDGVRGSVPEKAKAM